MWSICKRASIIAKVTRDRLMVEYDAVMPGYDFAANKGYGTKKHIEGLKELGPSPIHRMTFIKKIHIKIYRRQQSCKNVC